MFRRYVRFTFACLLCLAVSACFDKTTEVVESDAQGAVATESPRLMGAVSRSNTTILVSYSRAMGPSALQVSNYSISQLNVNAESGTLNVLSAAFEGTANDAVLLTTRSQSDLTYRLRVTHMFDSTGTALAAGSGEGNDARSATFSGTAPNASELVDTDGDGLYDSEEQRGWKATILLADGEGMSWDVSSNPLAADSDGDGLNDDIEKRIGSDPRDSDTDGDELSDLHEYREILSSAVRQDTDADGLMDGREFNQFRTSPLHRDTDGDQLLDGEEVLLPARNARAADVPLPAIEIGDVDLLLDVRFTATSAQGTRELETKSVASTLQQTQSKSFSNSDSTSHSVTAKATFEYEYTTKTDGPGYTLKGGAELGWTGQWTSSFTSTSSNETQKTVARTFSTDQEVTQNETVQRDIKSASIRVPLTIKSIGTIAFTIRNVQVTAFLQDPNDPGKLVPIATLVPDPTANVPNQFTLGPLVPERGPFLFANDQIFPSLVQDLMLNPRGLIFKVSNYDIEDELGRNFAFTSQAIFDRTAPLVIDYGAADSDGDGVGDTTDRFHVATSAGRPIADTNGDGRVDEEDRRVVFDTENRTVGITVGEALQDILNLRHFDEDANPSTGLSAGDLETSFSTRIVDGTRVLWRVRGVSKEMGNPLRQWEILTPEGIAPRSTQDFMGMVLQPQNGMTLAHVQDLDADRIPANWEFIHGCSDRSVDSDRDGINDGIEVFTGWQIDVEGRGTYRSFSSCARTDSDRDGLTDAQESSRVVDIDTDGDGDIDQIGVAAPTDPREPDTDEDGVSDAEELTGYLVETRVPFQPGDSNCELVAGTIRETIRCTSNPLDPDSDDDTLVDGGEVTLGTDPTVNDGDRVFDDDADGLSNFDETNGWDVSFQRVSTTKLTDGVLVTCTTQNDGVAECDGINEPTSDPNDADSDNDGIGDAQERELATHPRRADTDGDGRSDLLELSAVTGTCGGEDIEADTSPLDADTDNDLLSDRTEINTWTDGSWVIRVVGAAPYTACPNPAVADADLDTLVDGEERNLVNTRFGATPIDPNLADTDGDTFPDQVDGRSGRGTNPLEADQAVEFRYTQILTLEDCEGFADVEGEFRGGLFFQSGTQEIPKYSLSATMVPGQSVSPNTFNVFILRAGDSLRAFSRNFFECDDFVGCGFQTQFDDDLAEFDETFDYPVASAVRTYPHACGSEEGLQTTLVITNLP